MKNNVMSHIYRLVIFFVVWGNFLAWGVVMAQSIQATPNAVNFHITGPEGIYSANEPTGGIGIDVYAPDQNWTITCQADPLTPTSGGNPIPPERLLIRSEAFGGDFFPLNVPVVIANGSSPTHGTVQVNVLHFSLQLLSDD